MPDFILDAFRTTTPWPDILFRFFSAAFLGALLGVERTATGHRAGVRTQALLAMGACLFTLLAFEVSAAFILSAGEEAARVDGLRIAEAVTAGVAFLGAGAVITYGGQPHGLTSAAMLWLTGGVGLACGLGLVGLGAMACAGALFVVIAGRLVKSAALGGRKEAGEDTPLREPPPYDQSR